MSRIYPFEGIMNFRDFGDYPTQNGGHVKPAQLFRSAHFNTPTRDDHDGLSALNLGLVTDLRSKPERMRQPNKFPKTIDPHILEFEDLSGYQPEGLAPHEAFMKEELSVADDSRRYMNMSYAARPSDAGYKKIFSDTLKHMAATGDSIVIHCAAGKDRTGTLAAIILSALGVERDIVMDDYMLTLQAVDIEPFLEPAAHRMSERFERSIHPDALRPMFGVEPGYLENSLKTIGNMERYIQDDLGVTDKEKAALHHHYVQAA